MYLDLKYLNKRRGDNNLITAISNTSWIDICVQCTQMSIQLVLLIAVIKLLSPRRLFKYFKSRYTQPQIDILNLTLNTVYTNVDPACITDCGYQIVVSSPFVQLLLLL